MFITACLWNSTLLIDANRVDCSWQIDQGMTHRIETKELTLGFLAREKHWTGLAAGARRKLYMLFRGNVIPRKKKVSSCGGGFDMIVVRLLFIDVYCVFFRRNMLPLFMLQDRQHVEPSQSELQTVGFLFLTVLPLVVWSLSKQPADKCEFRQGSQLSYFLHLLTWVWVKPGEHHISWQMDVHPSKYCILFNNSFWCIHTYYIHLLHLLCSAVW